MSCSGRSRNNAGCSLKRPLLLTSESVPPVLSRWLRFPVSGSARRPRSSEAAPRTSFAVHTPGLHSSVEGQNSGRWRSTAGFWVRDLQQSARHRTPPRSGRALLQRSTILNPVSRPRGLPLGQSPALRVCLSYSSCFRILILRYFFPPWTSPQRPSLR